MNKNKLLKKLKFLERKKVFCDILGLTSILIFLFLLCFAFTREGWFGWWLLGMFFLVIYTFCSFQTEKLEVEQQKIKTEIIEKKDNLLCLYYRLTQLELAKIEKELDKKGFNYWMGSIVVFIIFVAHPFFFGWLVREVKINIFWSFLITVTILFLSLLGTYYFLIRNKNMAKKQQFWEKLTEKIWKISQKGSKEIQIWHQENKKVGIWVNYFSSEKETPNNRILCQTCNNPITDYSQSLNYCSVCLKKHEKN